MPIVDGQRAEQCLGELGLAVALDTGDADDLTAVDSQRQLVDGDGTRRGRHGHVLEHEAGFARLGGCLVHFEGHFSADHHRGECGLVGAGFGRADDLAATDDGDVVGDFTDFAELVGDEDDRSALVTECAHDLHEFVDLLRREDGRGFVEDQVLRSPCEGFQDLDPLLDADGEILDECVRIDGEVVAIGEFTHSGARGAGVEHPGLARLRTEHHVLGDGEHRDEHEVLVDHADAGVHRLLRAGHVERLLAESDLALVGFEEPEQYVHEGGLAGAVLSQEAVDATGHDVERDAVVRGEIAEALGDSVQVQRWRTRRRGGAHSPPSLRWPDQSSPSR